MNLQEQQDKREKSYVTMRSVLDFGMGVLYLAVGVFLLFYKQFGFEMELIAQPVAIAFGVLCTVYGVWRIYRGFKKNY